MPGQVRVSEGWAWQSRVGVVSKSGRGHFSNGTGSRQQHWPAGRGNFLKFVLHKENRDTNDALGTIAHRLHMKSSSFHCAGMKDRRAVSTQWITVFKYVRYAACHAFLGCYGDEVALP